MYGLDGTRVAWSEDLVTAPGTLDAMALSMDGRTLTTIGGSFAGGTAVTHWNVAPYGDPHSQAVLTGSGEQGLATAFTPDGRSMLTVGSNTRATVWDVTHPSAPVRRATSVVHDNRIYLAAFTPDARILAVADRQGHVRVSDMTDPARPVTVAEFVEVEGLRGFSDKFLISPDGRTVAMSTSVRGLVLWDVTPGHASIRLGPLATGAMPVTFSPSGRTLAAAISSGGGRVGIWTLDGPTGPTLLKELDVFKRPVAMLAFSPDGRTVVMGGYGEAVLWDLSAPGKGRQSGALSDVETGAAVFSRDGQTIAFVTARGASLWDFAGRADPIRVADIHLLGEPFAGGAATFAPNGRTLITSVERYLKENLVESWDLTALAELRADPSRQACAIAGTGLTEDEWARYIPELTFEKTCSS